jgi:hypothetical protein
VLELFKWEIEKLAIPSKGQLFLFRRVFRKGSKEVFAAGKLCFALQLTDEVDDFCQALS